MNRALLKQDAKDAMKAASGTHHPCFLGDPARRADHSWYCFQYLRLYYLLFCSHQLRHV